MAELSSPGVEIEPVDGRSKYWRAVAMVSSSSVNSELEDENDTGDFLTLGQVEMLTQRRVLSESALQGYLQRRIDRSSGEVQIPTQRQVSTNNGLPELRQRQLLPRSNAVLVSMQRQGGSTEPQEVPSRLEPRVVEERVQQVLDLDPDRHRVNAYGVIYSSQAVRDTMAAIEVLKRGRFDNAIIARTEASINAIVQTWLVELDKAAQPRG
ncbi:hypothetical protein F441_10280 [Phytophthora nicotianae CJ01A1]|nr:hypothetical protein F441_10280 [Phytophthora nicotianae CJ01A1]